MNKISLNLLIIKQILSSSVVERSAVNRLVVGSSPTWGEIKTIENYIFFSKITTNI